MADKPTVDDASDPSTGLEPHGQAALLLVESLIHELIAASALTLEQAIAIVETAVEVKLDAGESSAAAQESLRLLNAISASLRNDLPGA